MKIAFQGDWGVLTFYHSADVNLQISIPGLSSFLRHHVTECIHDILKKIPNQRPRASDLCVLFTRYSIMDFDRLIEAENYPSYLEWKQMRERTQTASQI